MNNIDRQYKELLEHILHFGVEKKDRTGTGTRSLFGWQIRHRMEEGFPLLTTKKMAWKSIVTELLWFLRGDTNIKYLVDNGCNIWNGDAYKNYVKHCESEQLTDYDDMDTFIKSIKNYEIYAEKWGELGPIYGQMWRDWDEDTGVKIDQIKNLIKDLKTNPDSRRLMVNAWNPTYIQHAVLPPCHYGFQVYTRELSIKERIELWEKIPTRNVMDFPIGELTEEQYHEVLDKIGVQRRAISLMWNQRSVDTFLGLPFNIASYGLLLEIIAREVNMVPDDLIGNLGDVHLYTNHIEQAKEQCSREGFELPSVTINERNWYLHEKVKERLGEKTFIEKIESYRPEDFTLNNYQSHPSIKAPLSN